ncbi:hypothetical protein ON010_g10722 [Phytophthora cinnamomi]|nr:hypothetical protein ON010_g10722 [Phytophthora cinnamomi]
MKVRPMGTWAAFWFGLPSQEKFRSRPPEIEQHSRRSRWPSEARGFRSKSHAQMIHALREHARIAAADDHETLNVVGAIPPIITLLTTGDDNQNLLAAHVFAHFAEGSDVERHKANVMDVDASVPAQKVRFDDRNSPSDLRRINEEVARVFEALDVAAPANWSEQWTEDSRLLEKFMRATIEDDAVVLSEFQSPRAQAEALLTLKFEIEQKRARNDTESVERMRSMMETIAIETRITRRGLPNLFLPSFVVELQDKPFARGSFGSLSRSNVVKIFGASHFGNERFTMVPECLKQPPTVASDVYSLAMCIIGGPPFAHLSDDDIPDTSRKGAIPAQPDHLSDDAWELVILMTSMDPDMRVTLQHVIDTLNSLASRESNGGSESGGRDCKCGAQVQATEQGFERKFQPPSPVHVSRYISPLFTINSSVIDLVRVLRDSDA